MRVVTLRKKMTLTILSLLGVILLIVGGVILPTYVNLSRLDTSITETETFLEKQYQKTKNMQKSLREIDAVNMQTAKYDAMTVKKGEDLNHITELENLAKAHHVTQHLDVRFVEKGKQSSGGKQAPLSYYEFSFLDYGSYSDLVAYVRALEMFPYYVEISSLGFEAQGADQKNGFTQTLALRFTAKMYASQ